VDASSVMTSFPVRVPTAVGVKLVETVQVPPDASDCGANGQLLVCAKSPVTETDVIVSGTDWRFFSVTSLAPLVVFTIWLEKETEVVDKTTGGPPASLLVPINPTRKIAAEHSTDCLKNAALEMGCAQKGDSKAARGIFFTPQPHTRQTMVVEYSMSFRGS